MPLKKSSSAGAPRPAAASGRGKRHEVNGHTQLSASELEQMLFDAARMRAANAHRGDPLLVSAARSSTLQQAAALTREHHVGALVIVGDAASMGAQALERAPLRAPPPVAARIPECSFE